MTPGESSARLRAVFLGELEEQVRVLNAELLALEQAPVQADGVRALFRVMHTLKGAARAADVPLVEQVCHVLEGVLVAARDESIVFGPEHFKQFFAAADALADAGDRLRRNAPLPDSPLARLRAELIHGPGAGADRGPQEAAVAAAVEPMGSVLVPARAEGDVRVEARRLDALLARVGELLGVRGDLAAWTDALETFEDRWQAVAHPADLAPNALHGDVEHLVRVARNHLRTMDRVTTALLGDVRGLRMRPFREACEGLPRMVRDLAAELGKEVTLAVDGGEVEAEREVLDGLREALVHLIRNAVDHGIERPEVRAAAGKPRHGMLQVTATRVEDRLVVRVADDGRGLDAPALRERLGEAGLPVPTDNAGLIEALLGGGLTGKAHATIVSGRGVGLDLVRAVLERLQGGVTASWETGQGMTWSLECFPAVAIVRTVLVEACGQVFALPSLTVDRLIQLQADDLREAGGRTVVLIGADHVPVVPLARLVPSLRRGPLSDRLLSVVLRVPDGGRRLAVIVDALLDETELIIQPLPGPAQRTPLVAGMAQLPTRQIALLLNVPTLVAAGLAEGVADLRVEGAEPVRRPRVLVVDDSITTRTLEQNILESAGYEVLTAVDGAQGLQRLTEEGADLVVSDVDMPRMDGFALCKAIRDSSRFQAIPIILVTGKEQPEDRMRGMDAGASAYLLKSGFDQQELLATVHSLLPGADA